MKRIIKKMCAGAALISIIASSCTTRPQPRARHLNQNTPISSSIVTLEKEQYIPEFPEPTPTLVSLGVYRISAYCPCVKCCGKTDGITASGAIATAGVTAAMNGVPFGTRILIDGHEYLVQDRGGGLGSNIIDIFFNTHEEALNSGLWYKTEVFMIVD